MPILSCSAMPTLDEALGVELDELADAEQILGVGREDDDVRVDRAEREQRLAVGQAGLARGLGAPVVGGRCACCHDRAVSSSAIALS